MKLPYPKHLDRTPVTAYIGTGISGDGVPVVTTTWTGKCRFEESSKQAHDTDGKIITLNAKVYMHGDIASSEKVLGGKVVIGGNTYRIFSGKRLMNPDGTVHHTELELM